MPFKDYKIIQKLKEGGTSEVYKAIEKDTGYHYVIKITDFSNISRLIWLNEIHMLKEFQYVRGMVKMFEFGELEDPKKGNYGYAVLELCDSDIMDRPIQESELLSIVEFLLQTISGMHTLGYCYCDLKMENILRKGTGFCLCDFSSCQPIGTVSNILYGTPHITAPELQERYKKQTDYLYNEKIDSWGLGCLLFEIVTHQKFDKDKYKKQLNINIPEIYKNLILGCLESDPNNRIDIVSFYKKWLKH